MNDTNTQVFYYWPFNSTAEHGRRLLIQQREQTIECVADKGVCVSEIRTLGLNDGD